MNLRMLLLLVAAGPLALLSGIAPAQLLYSEPFDDAAADVKINQQDDTIVSYVNYGDMTIGTTHFTLPEAPRAVPGGAPTRGILMQANLVSAAAVGANVLAGATPVDFSGDYRISFDAYLSVSNDPFPTSGSTEQLLWGIGTDDAGVIEARNTRLAGTVGTWGWLASENGYSTEDAVIFEDGTKLAGLGDTQLFQDQFFNDAFDMPVTPNAPNNAPANSWVRVDVEVLAGNVSVRYNDVEFFNQPSARTAGFAMLGYEDPFGSIAGFDPEPGQADFPVEDYQWGLFDNFTVTQIPEPSTLLGGLCVAVIMLLRSRGR